MKRRMHAIADRLRVEFPGSEFRSFVDTAPILERELAALAGLGWQAKNTMMIHPRLGSWLLLGGIATTLPLVPPPDQETSVDRCGTCTRCIDACPTGAITPYRVDARRCISYLTIERRETIAPEFFDAMGSWVYGCDICQEVCPHNSARDDVLDVGQVHSAYAASRPGLNLAEVLDWSEHHRREAFVNSPMKRASLAMMKRNALIAAGNALKDAPDAGLRARIESLAQDAREPELVRRTARDVLSRLA
jgi:epoxyqueuosine reductase